MSGDALQQIRSERAKAIPLGQIGRAEDVASVILFLLGSAGAHMTGQVIPVDGGEMMR
jgi:3-oxoacyl-[acyl-carrier protein] reductase